MNRELLKSLVSLSFAALLFAVLGFASSTGRCHAQEAFLRGDVNTDGQVSISDALMLRRWLFLGERPPPCEDAADIDDFETLNLTDAIRLISVVFLGGEPIPPPYPDVGVDPTPGVDGDLRCAAYDVVPPEETDDLIDLADVEGAPGEQVEIPVFITNSQDVEAFQIVVRYDPDVFQPNLVFTGRGRAFSFAGTFFEDPSGGNGPPDFGGAGFFWALSPGGEGNEDVFVAAYIPALAPQDESTGYELPPGSGTLVFKILGSISPSAPVGTIVSLEPTNGEDGQGIGPFRLRNELTHKGDARFASILPRTDGAILKIVGDQTFFRGDSDGSGTVEMNDAVHTLNYLFLGAETPACLDAADSDDSGDLNITDPVFTLTFLFLGGPRISGPYPESGRDPTPDGLDCRGNE